MTNLGLTLTVAGLATAFITVYFWAFIYSRDVIVEILVHRFGKTYIDAISYATSICIVLSGLEIAAIGRFLL